MADNPPRHRVVIIGGGFAGLYCAQGLRRSPVDVTLVDRRNFHLFQPLLYQVATGQLSPANIAAPLRGILKRQKNARVWLGEVSDFDPATKEVIFRMAAACPTTRSFSRPVPRTITSAKTHNGNPSLRA